MPSRSCVRALSVLLVVLLGACTRAADGPATPGPDPAFEAIRRARTLLGPPAAEMGSAALTARRVVGPLMLGDPAGASERADVAQTVISDEVVALERAVESAGELLVPQGAPPVARAWSDVVATGRELAGAARADVTHVVRLAEAETELEGLIAAWQEPGSRRQQLERLEGIEQAATGVADALRDVEERPACSAAVARRITAAETVAAATAELRGLAEDFRGNEFDQRRSELAADPYGLGTQRIGAADGKDLPCWLQEGGTETGVEALRAALDDLQQALNPAGVVPTGP